LTEPASPEPPRIMTIKRPKKPSILRLLGFLDRVLQLTGDKNSDSVVSAKRSV
jgi:hypothetical protein